MDDLSDIVAYYDVYDEPGRLDRHRLEFDLTWRYLERYLPPGADLLELGAAAGRYTVPLAQRGHRVTAVDLSERLTGIARDRAQQDGVAARIEHLVADARDLGVLAGRRYDAALIMGPLYHLVEEADRRLVLRQVRGLLVHEGLVFSAFISRFGALGDVMTKVPEAVTRREELQWLMLHGRDPETTPHEGFRGYFARAEEIAPLHASEGFNEVTLVGVEPCIGPYDEAYNRLHEPLRAAWLEVLLAVSAEPSIIGASRHLLYIGRRR